MGNIIFSVSEDYLLTPSDMELSADARWETHDLLLRKPVSQFTGPGLESLKFKMILSSSYGISPEKQLLSLRMMRDTGTVFPLIIGGKPVSQNYWYIESVSDSDRFYNAVGSLIGATVSVALKEYDDSNYIEEKTKADTYGAYYNAASVLLGGL